MKIKITKNVAEYMCFQADRGYEEPYKEEKIGLLFGRRHGQNISIMKAVYYKGGSRSRTSINYYSDFMIKRVKKLQAKLKMKWFGNYHTHVEVAGEKPYGISPKDKTEIIKEPSIVELIVAVWATDDSRKPKPGVKRLKGVKRFGDTNYRYVISGYFKSDDTLRLVGVVMNCVDCQHE